jgi:FKBP-type peptidyl-prolyl cis-trans isomerase FkpA
VNFELSLKGVKCSKFIATMFKLKFFFFVLSFILLSACKGYSKNEKKAFDEKIQKFIQKENLQLKKSSSGVYYKVVVKGKGKPIRYADDIRVMYKGKLLNGVVFDEQNSPVQFKLKNLIPAWKEVLVGKNSGSVFLIVTPPQMGYGSNAFGEIPENSCLFFEIKVMQTL